MDADDYAADKDLTGQDTVALSEASPSEPEQTPSADSSNGIDTVSASRAEKHRWKGLFKHPTRLALSILALAIVTAAGTAFWRYLQSYEWTDDVEIDGHLDPVSTRINDTVIRVYVENTYRAKAGQPLVDLDPRDFQVALESAAANLAEAVQAEKTAQQNYRLAVANLAGG